VVVRGFYALNDCGTPVRVAAWVVGLNFTLNLTLIWPLAEMGLAVSTSVAAAVQILVLIAIFSRRCASLSWRLLGGTAVRTMTATVLMAGVVYGVLVQMPTGGTILDQLPRVFVPIGLGGATYCAMHWLLGGRELSMLLSGKIDS